MDKAIVDKWLDRYPKLGTFIAAGTISLKMAREILEVDRWFMYNMYLELVQAGAVTACNPNCWRATPELKKYLRKRGILNEVSEESTNIVNC